MSRAAQALVRPEGSPAELTFLGATGTVTGSRFLLEVQGRRILIECGLYQEREFAARNWDGFPVDPRSIDAVVLTHAHLDHSGYLPRLVQAGFAGPVWCTPATASLAEILWLDAARIAVEDARFKKRRHEREGRRGPHPELPLYTVADARRAIGLLRTADYRPRPTVRPCEVGWPRRTLETPPARTPFRRVRQITSPAPKRHLAQRDARALPPDRGESCRAAGE